MSKMIVKGVEINTMSVNNEDFISLTDMLKAKDGDFFIFDWLRNRNTVEFLGIWEKIHNPAFNYGEFALIKSEAGLNSNIRDYADVSQAERLVLLNKTDIQQMKILIDHAGVKRLGT